MRPPVRGSRPQQPRGAADPSATRPAFMNNSGSEPNSPGHRLEPLRRARAQQLLSAGRVGIKPMVVVLGVEDHRHAVVELSQELVRCAGDDGAGFDLLAALAVVPALPQAGEAQGRAVLAPDEVGLLGSPALALPLVEARRRDDAPAGL